VRGYKASYTDTTMLSPSICIGSLMLPKSTEDIASRAILGSDSNHKKNDMERLAANLLCENKSSHASECIWRDTPSKGEPNEGFVL